MTILIQLCSTFRLSTLMPFATRSYPTSPLFFSERSLFRTQADDLGTGLWASETEIMLAGRRLSASPAVMYLITEEPCLDLISVVHVPNE